MPDQAVDICFLYHAKPNNLDEDKIHSVDSIDSWVGQGVEKNPFGLVSWLHSLTERLYQRQRSQGCSQTQITILGNSVIFLPKNPGVIRFINRLCTGRIVFSISLMAVA